jgi:drug/metabolite transporter (DMT)-like permease
LRLQNEKMMAQKSGLSWLLFGVLCLIWGSSFILMKEGLQILNAYEVAAIRILSAGLVLLPFVFKNLRQIAKQKISYIILSGLLGSFFPAFLFCIAETKIDSALAGTLNALTPLFVILTGVVLFGNKIPKTKIIGVVVGFTGCILLFLSYGKTDFKFLSFAFFVLLATLFYGINVNMVQKNLKDVGSMQIAAIAFTALIIPSLVVLYFAGFFAHDFTQSIVQKATLASAVLGIFGTAIASVLFYMLVKRAGAVFSSLVTYGIPFVAIAWGLHYGEIIGWPQVGGLLVILMGVFMANK